MPDYSTEFNSVSLDYGGGGNAPQGGGLDIKRMIRLRAPLMIAVFFIISVPAVVGIYFTSPTEYTVTAELVFRAAAPSVLKENTNRDGVPYEKFVSTQLQMLTGPTVLSRVLDIEAVRNLKEISEADDRLAFMRSHIKAWVNRGSELVTVSFRLKNKQDAALVLDKTITTYLEYARQLEQDIDYEVRSTINQQLDNETYKLEQLEREIRDKRMEIGIPQESINQIGPNQSEPYRFNLAKAMEDLNQTKAAILQLERNLAGTLALQEAYEKDPTAPIYAQGIEREVLHDGRVASVQGMKQNRQTDLEIKAQRFGDKHPDIQRTREDISKLEEMEAQEKIEVRGEVLASKIAQLEYELEAKKGLQVEAEERVKDFQAKIDEIKANSQDTTDLYASLKQAEAQQVRYNNKIAYYQNTLESMNIESQAPARVDLASKPVIPKGPDKSKMLQMMVLSVAFAGGCAVALGLFRELTDQQTRAPQDISNITSLPILAAIPDGRFERLPKNYHPPLLTADHPQSPSADEYRRILSRIIYPPDDTVEVNTCLVASPTRGDGKTTLACNLAVSLAQANRRVLLVDICPRDPSVEWCFGLERSEGLSEVLLDDMSYKMLARQTEFPNLNVIGPGFQAERLTGKLASRDMMEFIEQAEKDFDHVIIDTPPSLLMSDAKLLAPVVDGVIVTVGAETSSRGMVRRCIRELEQVNASIIGIVLNGIRPTRGGYMKRNLELFYDSPKKDVEKVDRGGASARVADFEPVEPGDDDYDEFPQVMLLTEEDADHEDEPSSRRSQFGG